MQQKIRKIFLSVLPFFAVFIPILLGVPQSAQALERRRLIPVGRTVPNVSSGSLFFFIHENRMLAEGAFYC